MLNALHGSAKLSKIIRGLAGLVGCASLILGGIAGIAACKKEAALPMRIAMHVWPGFEPLFLARHYGFLNERDFRLVEFSDGSEVGRAFRNRAVEAVCLTLDEALYLVRDGADPVIVLVLDESRGADAVLARPGIASVEELRGKRVAVEINAVETYTLTRALQSAGLTAKDITPVYLPMEKHLEAYQSGDVDAVVTYEPMRTKLLDLGAKDIFNSSKMPGEIVDVLVAHRDYLRNRPDRIKLLKKAWYSALAQIRSSPKETVEFMAIREQVTKQQFEKSLLGLHWPEEQEGQAALAGNPPKLMQSAERLKAVMLEANLLKTDIPIQGLFPNSENAHP